MLAFRHFILVREKNEPNLKVWGSSPTKKDALDVAETWIKSVTPGAEVIICEATELITGSITVKTERA